MHHNSDNRVGDDDDSNNQNHNNLFNLPNEILTEIILYLNNDSLVNFYEAFSNDLDICGDCDGDCDNYIWLKRINTEIDCFHMNASSWNSYCLRHLQYQQRQRQPRQQRRRQRHSHLLRLRQRHRHLQAYLQISQDVGILLDICCGTHYLQNENIACPQLERFAQSYNYTNEFAIPIILACVHFGANPNKVDSNGNSVLHVITQRDDMFRLLDAVPDINVNARNNDGRTLLHEFIFDKECFEQLLEYNNEFFDDIVTQDINGDTPLHLLARNFASCVDCDGDNYDNNTMINVIVQRVHRHRVGGRNPFNIQNNNGNTPLHEILLALAMLGGNGDDGDDGDSNSNGSGSDDGDGDSNITGDGDFNSNGDDFNGDCNWKHVVDFVERCGANVDIQNTRGSTPLHVFARHFRPNCLCVFRKCVDASTQLNVRDNQGRTVLDVLSCRDDCSAIINYVRCKMNSNVKK